MGEAFGSWSSQYGETPNDTWMRGLSALSDKQITHGLSRVVTEQAATPSPFPPNLPQFVSVCKTYSKRPAPYYRQLEANPQETDEHRKARQERGREEMARVKALLAGGAK